MGLEFRDAGMPTWPSDAEVSTLCKCMKLDTLSVFQKEVAGEGATYLIKPLRRPL